MSIRTRRPAIGATAYTADDMTIGTITKVGLVYAYTDAGQRIHLDSFMQTWTAA